MHKNMREKYPVITKIVSLLADDDGKLEKPTAEFILSLVKHTLGVYRSTPIRSDQDYNKRTDGELDSQFFPNFPMLMQKANYDKKMQERRQNWLKRSLSKRISQPQNFNPWSSDYDLCL